MEISRVGMTVSYISFQWSDDFSISIPLHSVIPSEGILPAQFWLDLLSVEDGFISSSIQPPQGSIISSLWKNLYVLRVLFRFCILNSEHLLIGRWTSSGGGAVFLDGWSQCNRIGGAYSAYGKADQDCCHQVCNFALCFVL